MTHRKDGSGAWALVLRRRGQDHRAAVLAIRNRHGPALGSVWQHRTGLNPPGFGGLLPDGMALDRNGAQAAGIDPEFAVADAPEVTPGEEALVLDGVELLDRLHIPRLEDGAELRWTDEHLDQ